MQPLVLFTEKEMGNAILPIMINARFNAFFARFAARYGSHDDFAGILETAREILREAEIPQPGDELLEGTSPIDLTPFFEKED